jgi:hypothetical protein
VRHRRHLTLEARDRPVRTIPGGNRGWPKVWSHTIVDSGDRPRACLPSSRMPRHRARPARGVVDALGVPVATMTGRATIRLRTSISRQYGVSLDRWADRDTAIVPSSARQFEPAILTWPKRSPVCGGRKTECDRQRLTRRVEVPNSLIAWALAYVRLGGAAMRRLTTFGSWPRARASAVTRRRVPRRGRRAG